MRWQYKFTVLALCTVAFFVTMAGRLAISPLIPDIADEFRVSYGIIGAALTGMWLAYGLMQFPSGILADKYGERLVILLSVTGTAAMAIAVAGAPIFAVFVGATVVLGGVAGLHYSVATTLFARTFDDVGTAIGIHNTGGTIAGLVTPVAVVWVAVLLGWRGGVAFVAAVGLPVAALFAWRIKPTPPRRPDESLRRRLRPAYLLDLLARPAIAFTLVIAILTEFAWQAVSSFLPTFLIEYRGLSATMAAAGFSLYFVALGVGQVGVGAAADRFGIDRSIVASLLVGVLAVAILLAIPGTFAGVIGVVLLGFGMSFSPAVFPRFLREFTDAEQTAGFGLVRTVYMVVAALGSVVTGVIADVLGWGPAFGFLAALLGVVIVGLLANWLFDLGL